MKSVMDIEKEQDVKLNGLVTVVNALKASKQMKAFGEFFNNQIEYATTVVLSRTQKASEAQLRTLRKTDTGIECKSKAIITTPWDEIKGEQILKKSSRVRIPWRQSLAEAHHREEEEHEHHHDHEHHHEHEHEHHHDHEHEHHHDHEHEHEHHHDHEHEHGENCTCGCHDHDHEHGHHHADDVFTNWGRETPHKYTKRGY